jgi:pimeloyl-ACP methyl ester carboxylesterase
MKSRVGRIVSAAVFALALLLPAAAGAQTAIPGPCLDGELPSGAKSRICVPVVGWNGQLVVFAHGYVAVQEDLGFQDLTVGGVPLALFVQGQGYAYATTTYRQNGLAILEGADDIRELVNAFTAKHGVPQRTFITGASEGGLVAALLLEQSPDMFSAGLAACGPVGSFRGQVNYVGDFRVLFDYFFPNVIPGTVVDVPPDVAANWTEYVQAIVAALQANPARAVELMRTSGAAYDPANPATIVETTINVLWYNVFGGDDAETKLGGNPYGNQLRWYFGSSNDLRLNLRVRRFTASPTAVANMRKYETTGRLTQPLVTLHTKGDGVVPFWHEPLYLAKVFLTGHSGLLPLPVDRYGHCTFNTNELLTAFALTVR